MIEKLLNEYYEKFGENYPLSVGDGRSSKEIIKDIKHCIESGEKAESMIYDEDKIY